ncbi:hypothetical protein [Thermovibrio sp.]
MRGYWKFLILFLLLSSLSLTAYLVLRTPKTLKEIDVVVVEKHGNWKAQISQHLLATVRPGAELSPLLVEEVKRELSNLPWIRKSSVNLEGGVLKVKIWEEPPSYSLYYKGSYYLVGENGFVLSKESSPPPNLPVYYYRDKDFPFTLKDGFLKVGKTVKMEIKLANNRIKELFLNGEPPQVFLGGGYTTLIFKKSRVLVYLSPEEKSWENFENFLSEASYLKPGVYDFRFYDMLVKGGVSNGRRQANGNRLRNKCN